MARNSPRILDDDDEYDIASSMLNACGLDFEDFFLNERILTRENLEKNFQILLNMVKNRSFLKATYFVIGYFILITGSRLPEDLRVKILDNTRWDKEEIYWSRKEDKIERQIYLKDFCEKINNHIPGRILHPIRLIYFNGDQSLYTSHRSEVIIGLNELEARVNSKDFYNIHHILLQGEGLERIPDSLYKFINLQSLSLEFNQIKFIPEIFTKLTSLKTLYLNYNEFIMFPEILIKLPLLKFLSLDNNYITKLPESLKKFNSLERLSIRMNNINKVPSFLSNVNY